jgi:hypothetical protein
MNAGQSPRRTALDIAGRIDKTGRRQGGLIGLSSPQMEYIANARAELRDPEAMANYLTRARRDRRFDKSVQRAMAAGKSLKSDAIDKIVGRYSDRLLALRGEVIARTESLTAFSSAQWEAMQQLVESGQVEGVEKVWRSAGDARVRHSHSILSGVRKPLGEPFRSPTGAMLQHPGDGSLGAGGADLIACRCWMEPKVDWLR